MTLVSVVIPTYIITVANIFRVRFTVCLTKPILILRSLSLTIDFEPA